MVDLTKLVGLDIKFDEKNYKLSFAKGLTQRQPAVRTLDQMREVLVDESISLPKELYYMYRDVHNLKDEELLKKYKLRFDITVIKPGILGSEFMKTQGHYHPKDYPELYEVVYGQALCLQQRRDLNDFRKIKEVILVRARQGQKIVCLPNFGHILINPGDKPLITSNWVSSEFSSEYELYKQSRGAAYYAFSKNREADWQENNFYSEIPAIKFVTPNDEIKEFGLKTSKPMYSLVDGLLEKVDFLNHPDRYQYDNVFKK